MMWIERKLGKAIVANRMVKIIELAIGTVNAASEWSMDVKIPGTYPIKKSINGPPAQKR